MKENSNYLIQTTGPFTLSSPKHATTSARVSAIRALAGVIEGYGKQSEVDRLVLPGPSPFA